MYIGSKKIKDINDGLVTFEDGTQQSYTKKALTYLQTEEALDPSGLQDLSCREIAKEVVAILLSHDARISDLNGIFTIVQGTIDTERARFLIKASGLYSNIEKELESITDEGDRKIEELNLLDKYLGQIRMSHYTKFIS